jgi:transposase
MASVNKISIINLVCGEAEDRTSPSIQTPLWQDKSSPTSPTAPFLKPGLSMVTTTGREITSSVRAQIVSMNQAGMTGYQIAKELKMVRQTVYTVLKRYKEKGAEEAINPKGRRHSIDVVTSLIALHEEGYHSQQISDILEITHATVKNMLFTLRSRGKEALLNPRQTYHSIEKKREVVALYQSGQTPKQISEFTKMPLITVHFIIKKFRVEGVEAAVATNRLPPEFIQNVIQYRQECYTSKQIAKLMGSSERNINGIVQKYSIPRGKAHLIEGPAVVSPTAITPDPVYQVGPPQLPLPAYST